MRRSTIALGTLRFAAATTAGATTERAGAMSDADAVSFHRVRPRLFGIAYRVLGSATEAEDVVQDAWIRWQGTDRTKVRDAAAFLATTTARLAINVDQSARARRETSFDPRPVEPVDTGADPSLDVEQREALELAVRTLLEKLSPTERAVYVLREAFDYPYLQIAGLLALSEVNARQLVTRARRRLSAGHRRPVAVVEQQRVLEAFVVAAQTGDLATLEQLLAAGVADCAGDGEAVHVARGPMGGGSPLVRVAA
jgi:RNA polymerase sigma-70 factor (ECF subfamily)